MERDEREICLCLASAYTNGCGGTTDHYSAIHLPNVDFNLFARSGIKRKYLSNLLESSLQTRGTNEQSQALVLMIKNQNFDYEKHRIPR